MRDQKNGLAPPLQSQNGVVEQRFTDVRVNGREAIVKKLRSLAM